eukprot:TRINITY_DN16300_c0_g1_i1.p1 TRINITY_DN16300_c0_g1~~TRINITY_DN16300_c0_g1_i1.p1  ORF type:complete len:226 (-),score=40.76 TRINITY_DN16300_c0_g1_i1:173-850(-)
MANPHLDAEPKARRMATHDDLRASAGDCLQSSLRRILAVVETSRSVKSSPSSSRTIVDFGAMTALRAGTFLARCAQKQADGAHSLSASQLSDPKVQEGILMQELAILQKMESWLAEEESASPNEAVKVTSICEASEIRSSTDAAEITAVSAVSPSIASIDLKGLLMEVEILEWQAEFMEDLVTMGKKNCKKLKTDINHFVCSNIFLPTSHGNLSHVKGWRKYFSM